MDYELGWNGVPLQGPVIGFDTETEAIQEDEFEKLTEWPRLVLASASDGERTVVLYPDQVGAFVEAHVGYEWVLHNSAFDYWAVKKHLHSGPFRLTGERAWSPLPGTGRFHDTMLLDQLVRIADGRTDVSRRSLERLGADYQVTITKDFYLPDAPEVKLQVRYKELIGREAEWPSLPKEWFEYPAQDALATLKLYFRLCDRARTHMRRAFPDQKEFERLHREFGLLTERIQVGASCALAETGRVGFATDSVAARSLEERLRLEMWGFVADHPHLFRRWRAPKKVAESVAAHGHDFQLSDKAHAPQMDYKALRGQLLSYADLAKASKGRAKFLTPKTKELKTARELWEEEFPDHPFIQAWVRYAKVTKFLAFIPPMLSGVVRTKYQTLVRTGRTSAQDPNVQQIPRGADFRSIFIARPGHKLVVADYSAIELVTLAAVCLSRYGWSKLAETLKAGRDPHAYTAALVQGLDYEAFLGLKGTPEFKTARQAAKAINFGVPGGLGARKLALYAKANYGVDLTEDQASKLRSKLITEVYPELESYLMDEPLKRLALKFRVPYESVRAAFGVKDSDDNVGLAIKDAVAGRPTGPRRSPAMLWLWGGEEGVFRKLSALAGRTDAYTRRTLETRCRGMDPDVRADFAERLFEADATTLTGRTRGRVSYTEARNTPFQGLAADGAKLALWRLTEAGHRVVAFVHDEVVVECTEGTADASTSEVVRVMSESMSGALQCDLPVQVAVETSTRWEKPK
jgi:hypothetical protein